MPVAEFLGELADALSAAFRDEDRDLAQPLRPQGSGWAPKWSVSHARDDTPAPVLAAIKPDRESEAFVPVHGA